MIQIGMRQVVISEEVIRVLEKYRQGRSADPEAGGILLGERNDRAILISKVTTPNSQDKRSRFSFLRVKAVAQLIINYEHENSAGRITYLGEWHTHPEDIASPSVTDLKMIKEQFRKSTHDLDCFLLIIIGRKVHYCGMYDGNTILASHFRIADRTIEPHSPDH